MTSLALWYQSVGLHRGAVGTWQAKGSKHMAVALPLQTQLLCLDSDSAFLHGINSLVDNLQKQLRVRAPACSAFKMRARSATCHVWPFFDADSPEHICMRVHGGSFDV